MTIKNAVKAGKIGAQLCYSTPLCRAMIVHACFLNNEKQEDETSFDLMINKNAINELDELYAEFCKENDLKRNTVTSITVVATAATMDDLQKITDK